MCRSVFVQLYKTLAQKTLMRGCSLSWWEFGFCWDVGDRGSKKEGGREATSHRACITKKANTKQAFSNEFNCAPPLPCFWLCCHRLGWVFPSCYHWREIEKAVAVSRVRVLPLKPTTVESGPKWCSRKPETAMRQLCSGAQINGIWRWLSGSVKYTAVGTQLCSHQVCKSKICSNESDSDT